MDSMIPKPGDLCMIVGHTRQVGKLLTALRLVSVAEVEAALPIKASVYDPTEKYWSVDTPILWWHMKGGKRCADFSISYCMQKHMMPLRPPGEDEVELTAEELVAV